ncbi:HD-GYP domain-containing protein [Propionivibrio soli]|uniref:HD-GYP domain-containing protein n=1 Tax=Propionivibrio soli TaxID=2976531 RepID=UPI0021E7AFFE|nr:HD domain-containing phosphohydrolase [Propionivibrio soli]
MSGTVGGNPANEVESFCAVNPHCLHNIVRLSDDMEVMASSDIYDERGTKLWAKGAAVSRSLQEKMLLRRLQKPLELSLDVEHGVTLETVVGDCFEQIEANRFLGVLGGASGARSILRSVRGQPLPGPLKLLLTSSREHKRQNYDTTIAGIVVSAGLANGIGLNERDSTLLVLSALVHDIGEMYINPEYLDGSRQLQPSEWKHVASHPCVGQAFLKEFTTFPPAVGDCVLHHHERLDGSGYPFQLSGASMSPLGKVMCVADSVASIIMRGGPGLRDRVAVALRIVPEEFPRRAVSFFTQALAAFEDAGPPAVSESFAQRVLPTLQQLRKARLLAEDLSNATSTPRVAAVGLFALDAIRSIDRCLRATGVYDLSQLEVLERDPAVMGEVCIVLDEVTWRLRNLARNVYLRLEQSGDATDLALIDGLIAALNPPR